jgi:hypothetical protein
VAQSYAAFTEFEEALLGPPWFRGYLSSESWNAEQRGHRLDLSFVTRSARMPAPRRWQPTPMKRRFPDLRGARHGRAVVVLWLGLNLAALFPLNVPWI